MSSRKLFAQEHKIQTHSEEEKAQKKIRIQHTGPHAFCNTLLELIQFIPQTAPIQNANMWNDFVFDRRRQD